MRFVIWLAEQELKTHAIQEHEVAAAVRVQALYRGRSARQLGSSACESGAGLGGPAALAKRAAAAQQRDTQQFALRNGIDFRELNALLRKSGRPTSSWTRKRAAITPATRAQRCRFAIWKSTPWWRRGSLGGVCCGLSWWRATRPLSGWLSAK